MLRVALTEARLVIAKLLWHFDMELDGDHSTWVEDARFYVGVSSNAPPSPLTAGIGSLGASAAQRQIDAGHEMIELGVVANPIYIYIVARL
jgi:hypothetical protein